MAALPRPLLYLQVGAFAQRENAERLRERLLGEDLPPCHITPLRSGSQLLYRLRIGPLDSVERADALIEPLTRLGLPDARIVVDGSGEPMRTDGT